VKGTINIISENSSTRSTSKRRLNFSSLVFGRERHVDVNTRRERQDFFGEIKRFLTMFRSAPSREKGARETEEKKGLEQGEKRRDSTAKGKN